MGGHENPRLTRRRFLEGAAGAAAGAGLLGSMDSLALARRQPVPRTVDLDSAVFGGELQYFRMSPSAVPRRLELCRQASFSVIQTYVPWNVHEFTPGRIDFDGRTHPVLPDDHLDEYQDQTPVEEIQSGGLSGRGGLACNTNLTAFLEHCRRMGFAVILRPGPFISDEWRNGGLPDWFLAEAPPQAYAYGPDGTPLTPGAPNGSYPVAGVTGGQTLFYFPTLCYASPYYLSAAQRWLRAFARFVRPWLVTRGGPVIALQVDDETCFFYRFGPFEVDYNPAMLARYRRLGAGSAPRRWPAPGAGVVALRPAVTWQRFKGEQIARYLSALRSDLRRDGVDVPITHEIELILTPPADVAADGTAALVNPELYPGGTGPEAMPLIELTANAVRAAQRNRVNVWSAEQESEILLSYLLLGEGIVGGIQFDYTDGVTSGDVADHSRLGRSLRTAGRLISRARRRADVAIIWDNSLTRLPYGSDRWGFTTDVRRAIEQHVPALATLLLRSGLAFDLLDVEAARRSDFDPAVYPTIFLAAADILPRRAQRNLVAYVRAGGRLVCWPAPPTLDENLRPCSLVADACYPEPRLGLHPQDVQEIELLGRRVRAWRGVQTFRLTAGARAIAHRAGEPCGYLRRLGRGEALLLGTWLAADWVPGRGNAILEEQSLPSPASSAQVIELGRTLARRRLGDRAAELVSGPLPGGSAQDLILYAYENQRRGGDVISGGALAYWDGQNVVGLVEVNTTETGPVASRIPYHPIEPATISAARELAAVRPHVEVSDGRVQARLLAALEPGTATVVAANRWAEPVRFTLSTTVDGKRIRLPLDGAITLPASTAMLLPIGYRLGAGVTLLQASAQLLGAHITPRRVRLEFWSPGGGEAAVRLPDGRTVHLRLEPGERSVVLE